MHTGTIDVDVKASESGGSTRVRPLLIYLHIPFCRSKCHFCDWVQPIPKSDLLLNPQHSRRRSYMDALMEEIRHHGRRLTQANYHPLVLYWGGGTASSVSENEATMIMSAIRESFHLESLEESTIECSPDTISAGKLRFFRELGFDRFSMGAQSLDNTRLKHLGRLHTAETVSAAVESALAAGFQQISIDLMCGFPDETIAEVRKTMTAGLQLPITHLSIYPFRPTPGTVMRRRIPEDADSYLKRQMIAFGLARKMASQAGLTEYAVGYFGQVALNVVLPFRMQVETIGFGSGAISLLDGKYLGHSKGNLTSYISDPLHWDFSSAASAAPVAFSFLRSGLSVFDGITYQDWKLRTGVPLAQVLAEDSLQPPIHYLRTTGRLIEDDIGIRLPRESVANTLLALNFRATIAENQQYAQQTGTLGARDA